MHVTLRQRMTSLPPIATDAALALLAGGFGAAQLLIGGGGPRGPFHSPSHQWAIEWVLVAAACLLLRSRYPVATLLLVSVFAIFYIDARGPGLFPVLPSLLIAIASVIADSTRPILLVWAIAIGAAVVITGAEVVTNRGDFGAKFSGSLLNGGWITMAFLLGEALRNRRAFGQEAELRALQAERARLEAEHAQRELAQRRVTEERLQIARELHDILAHTVALINVQAGVAAHVIDEQPEQAREALIHIKEASHATLQELRALVGVLRDPDGPTPVAPAPGLATLDELIETVRDAGVAVEVELERPPEPLPAAVDLAAYRILQEALTNVVKHAGPALVRIAVCQDEAQLTLSVTNSAGEQRPRPRGYGTGHGIAGMRERAATIGGTLQAGDLPDGGFRVSATLPLRQEAA